MYHILAGPEFNSPDRRPTSSLGILGATQKQAVCVIKARLPEDALETRKLAAVGKPEDRLTDYVCGVEHTDPAIMDVLPNELVFRVQTTPVSEVNMQSFVAEHPVYGKQYLTGDIQVEAFSALNGLPADEYKLVFVGTRNRVTAGGAHLHQVSRRDRRSRNVVSTGSRYKSAAP